MNRLTTSLLTLLLSLCAMGATLPTGSAGAQQAEAIAVVVSKQTPVDAMSLAELRRIFLGRSVEKRGVKLIPLNHKIHSPTRTAFDRAVLGMSPQQAGRHWVSERIRGTRTAPKSVGSTALLLKVVAKVKGVISYVPASKVPGGLKVVKIDGSGPGDDAYAIR